MHRILSSLESAAWSSCSLGSSLVGGSKFFACSRGDNIQCISVTCMLSYQVVVDWYISITQYAEWTGCRAGTAAFPANGNKSSSMLISLRNKVRITFWIYSILPHYICACWWVRHNFSGIHSIFSSYCFLFHALPLCHSLVCAYSFFQWNSQTNKPTRQ